MLRKVLVLLLFTSLGVNAQEIDFGVDYKNANAKYESGDYQGAITAFTELIPKLAEVQFEDSTYYMKMYNIIGDSYLNLNKPNEALPWLLKVSNHYSNASNKLNYDLYFFSLAKLYEMNGKNISRSDFYLKKLMVLEKTVNGENTELYIDLLTNYKSSQLQQFNLPRVDSCVQVIMSLSKQLYGESSLKYAYAMKGSADILKEQAKYELALSTYQKVKVIFKDSLGSKNLEYAKLLNSMALLYEAKQRYQEAEESFKEAAEAYKLAKGETSVEYSDCLYKLAMIYRSESKNTQSEQILLKISENYKASLGENDIHYILSLKMLGDLNRSLGFFELAEKYYLKCSELLVKNQGEKNGTYASLLNNMALLSVERSNYEEAEKRYLKSLEITKEIHNVKHPSYAHTLENLALLYKNLGKYEKAEPMFKEALQIQKEVLGEKHTEYGESLNNFADFYESLGQHKEAEKLYKQSLQITKDVYGTNHPEYAKALNNLGTMYENSLQNGKAEEAFNESLSIIEKTLGVEHPQYALTLDNLANLYLMDSTKLKKAEELNLKDQEIIKKKLGVNNPSYAFSLSTRARILEKMGKYDDALKIHQEVERIRKGTLGEHHITYTGTLIDLARVYAAKGMYKESFEFWKKGLANYNEDIRQRFTTMSEREREEFYTLVREKFEQFNAFALLAKDQIPDIAGALYNMQLETKSLLFRASNKMRQRIMASNDPVLIDKFNTWLQKKELLAKYLALPKDKVDKNLDSLELVVNQLEKSLESSSAGFKDANDSKLRTWQEVQAQLKPDEAAVEMIFFNSFTFKKGGTFLKWGDSTKQQVNYVALVLTPGMTMPKMVVMNNSSELQYRLINYYRNVVKFKTKDELCYDNFWKPIQDVIPKSNKIFFSPAGVYNQINLLTMYDNSTQKYLIEERDVEIVSNTWDLTVTKGAPSNSKKVTLFGNPAFGESHNPGDGERGAHLAPLPGTSIEVTKINSTLSAKQFNGVMLTESQATEENIKSLRDARIVHIATHGFFKKDNSVNSENNDEVNPLLKSGIYLANSIGERVGTEDGILTAFEAMNLNLDNTDLVVLSACETGLGASSNGEGVSGLQKAFRVAGAQTVILSLWKVNDDATQKLMSYFYEELVKSGNVGNVRQAFRAAQLKLKAEMNDPKFWGAFVVVGY